MSYSETSSNDGQQPASNHLSPGSGGPAKARLVVCDDHELVRSAFACLLERCGYQVVGQACNGVEAIEAWKELKPDVTLLDMRMPVLDGVGVVQAILSRDADARIVMLSTFDCDDHVIRAISAGARGYLLKGVSPEMLCQCIETVHAGGKFIVPELAQRLAISATAPAPTHREIEVLHGVAQGLSNKRIARVLRIEEGTVKAHLKSILRKLEASSRTQAASIAIRRGLVEV
jgi:two-component system NarL family response regulator